MTSLSTRFFGQPKLTNPTFNGLFSAEEFLPYRIAVSTYESPYLPAVRRRICFRAAQVSSASQHPVHHAGPVARHGPRVDGQHAGAHAQPRPAGAGGCAI